MLVSFDPDSLLRLDFTANITNIIHLRSTSLALSEDVICRGIFKDTEGFEGELTKELRRGP